MIKQPFFITVLKNVLYNTPTVADFYKNAISSFASWRAEIRLVLKDLHKARPLPSHDTQAGKTFDNVVRMLVCNLFGMEPKV